MRNRKNLILDACVLLNLLATGVIERILKTAAQTSMICALVQNESLYLRDELDVSETIPVDIEKLIENGTINLCDLETDNERQMFVNLAIKLNDGEAASLAIALSRNWHIATDDKKARKIFLENAENGQQTTVTSNLIKEWAEKEKVSPETLRKVLAKVEIASHYFPASSDPNFQWWNDILSTSE